MPIGMSMGRRKDGDANRDAYTDAYREKRGCIRMPMGRRRMGTPTGIPRRRGREANRKGGCF